MDADMRGLDAQATTPSEYAPPWLTIVRTMYGPSHSMLNAHCLIGSSLISWGFSSCLPEYTPVSNQMSLFIPYLNQIYQSSIKPIIHQDDRPIHPLLLIHDLLTKSISTKSYPGRQQQAMLPGRYRAWDQEANVEFNQSVEHEGRKAQAWLSMIWLPR